jgi:hypothetical protein
VISVLLPVRNAADTVERAVLSVLEGTLRPDQLVAVDDGSTDGTRALLERIPGVEVVPAQGRGLVAALQTGLSFCRAPLIARMDADDESLPRRLECCAAALESEPTLAAVGTGVELFRDDRPVSPGMRAYGEWLSSLVTPEALFRDRLVESPLCHPSVVIRRSALDEVGGWSEGPFPEDYALWLSLLERGHRLVNLPEVLFRWRDHDARATRVDPRYALGRHLELKVAHLLRTVLRPGAHCTVWGAGPIGRRVARGLRSRGVTVERLIEVDERKLGRRVSEAPVESYRSLGAPDGAHLISAVGAKGARAEIRAYLSARGWVEGRDFTCVA